MALERGPRKDGKGALSRADDVVLVVVVAVVALVALQVVSAVIGTIVFLVKLAVVVAVVAAVAAVVLRRRSPPLSDACGGRSCASPGAGPARPRPLPWSPARRR